MSHGTLRLPAGDHVVSPHTGWTRAHWMACADHLLDAAKLFVSPAGARVRFPGAVEGSAVDELEGFARLFMLAALRSAGAPPWPELDHWSDALAAGASTNHPEAWPRLGHHDQATVEAAGVALGLHWTRPWLWDQLPEQTQTSVVDWLSGVRGTWCADNNHVLLGATIQAFLASVGAPHDAEDIEAALDRTEDWYVGDGWYSDGTGRRFDHYNAFTFHLYPFFIEQMLTGTPAGARGPDPAFDVHRRRLRLFLDDYQHLFAPSGAPVLQGRSLIYRWAMAAPFWMAEIQRIAAFPPGTTRHLTSAMLANFSDSPDLARGVLSLGWRGPAPDLLQSYNRPGSPLWASKGFLGLLLPPEDPVWTEPELPRPVPGGDGVIPLSPPGWLVQTTPGDEVVRLLNHGSDGHPRRDDKWYRRLAFSTHTVPVELDGLSDNTIVVGAASVHRGLRSGVTRRTGAASRFHLDSGGRDVVVDLATTVVGPAELRLARVRGVLDQVVRCSGYALPYSRPLTMVADGNVAGTRRHDGLVSEVAAVAGTSGPVTPHVHEGPHETALGAWLGLPYLELDAGGAGVVHLAWLVHLGTSGWDAASAVDAIAVDWHEDGATVSIRGRVRSVAWLREDRWAADSLNQGIFRAGSRPDPASSEEVRR